jgi:hypothetical protein
MHWASRADLGALNPLVASRPEQQAKLIGARNGSIATAANLYMMFLFMTFVIQ